MGGLLRVAALGAAAAAAVGFSVGQPAQTATAVAHPQPAAAGQVVSGTLPQVVRRLPVATETRTGYDRDDYTHWVDADRDCRDTRDEVLAAESRTAVSGCDVRAGRWLSYYDRAWHTDSSALEIDHLVALAEAHDSGANRWSSDTRRRYANDLGDPRALVAVTAKVNQSKSARDPAAWLPGHGRCRYAASWVAVKTRWSLSVDTDEKRALTELASRCAGTRVKVRTAKVVLGTDPPAPDDTGGGTVGTGADDPRFDYCSQATDAGYGPYVKGKDPEYGWYTDGDGDGVVCE